MALDKQKRQAIIVIIQNNTGANLVKPSVAFKKPLETIPRTTAPPKNR